MPGDSAGVAIGLDGTGFDESMIPFDKPVSCTVAFADEYGREVFLSSRELTFVRSRTESVVCAKILPTESSSESELSIGILNVTSFGTGYSHISVSVTHEGNEVMARNASVEQGQCLSIPLVVSRASVPADSYCKVVVSVSCGGVEFFKDEVRVAPKKKVAHVPNDVVPSKRIFGECRFQRVIDVHESKDGDVKLGELILSNAEPDKQQISVSLTVEGTEILFSNHVLPPSSESGIVLACTALSLFRQEAYSVDVCCTVRDSIGSLILCRSMTIDVLSKYDLDLRQLTTRTVEFIDPLNAAVKDFVDNRDGPLARAMGNRYSVTGYQDSKKILPQMEAVYNALHAHGLSYVSDTSTLESGFQRVRSPDKVLQDHTGNCIELSILFASIFESMGLEPVVVFPKGHAIVGVVTGTNLYESEAKPVESDEMVLRMGGSRHFDAVFIESTMCPYDWASFSKAVEKARTTVSRELDYISKGRYALVERMRKKGIKTTFR